MMKALPRSKLRGSAFENKKASTLKSADAFIYMARRGRFELPTFQAAVRRSNPDRKGKTRTAN